MVIPAVSQNKIHLIISTPAIFGSSSRKKMVDIWKTVVHLLVILGLISILIFARAKMATPSKIKMSRLITITASHPGTILITASIIKPLVKSSLSASGSR